MVRKRRSESDFTNKPVTQKQRRVKATKALKSYPPLPELPRAHLYSIHSTSNMVFLPVSTASLPSESISGQSLNATPGSSSLFHLSVSQHLLDQSLPDIHTWASEQSARLWKPVYSSNWSVSACLIWVFKPCVPDFHCSNSALYT